MISYSWGYKKPTVDSLYKYLVGEGYNVWKDDEGGLAGHVVDGMATAVENADILVVCISQNYFDSKNCKKELEYADELGKTMVVVKLDPDLKMTGQGAFSMILSKQLYIQDDDEQSLFTRVDERLQALTGKAVSEPKAKPPLTSAVFGTGVHGEIFRGIFKQGNQQGGWTRMEGLGAFIAAGPSGVFGIGCEGKRLFYKEGSYKAANIDAYNQGPWQQIPGDMPIYISSGKEHVYAAAVGAFGRMQGMRIENGKLAFQWDVKEQGEAKIAVISASKGSASIWAVDSHGQLYFKSDPLAATEVVDNAGGPMKHIEAGECGVFGINHAGDVFFRVGTQKNNGSKGTHWQQLPGRKLTQIAASCEGVFGIDRGFDVFTMTNLGFDDHGIKFDGWKHIPGVKLRSVSVHDFGKR